MDDVVQIPDAYDDDCCIYCQRKFTKKDGKSLNVVNRKRHLDFCAAKHSKVPGQKTITSFFTGKKAKVSHRHDTFDTEGIVITEVLDNSHQNDTTDVAITDVLNNMLVTVENSLKENYSLHPNVDNDDFTVEQPESSLSLVAHCSPSPDLPINLPEFCDGLSTYMSGNFFETFPFQELSKSKLVLNGKRFHTSECFNNHFIIFPESNIRANGEILNVCCYDLRFDNQLKRIVKANWDINIAASHVNDQFLSHQQMHQSAKYQRAIAPSVFN